MKSKQRKRRFKQLIDHNISSANRLYNLVSETPEIMSDQPYSDLKSVLIDVQQQLNRKLKFEIKLDSYDPNPDKVRGEILLTYSKLINDISACLNKIPETVIN